MVVARRDPPPGFPELMNPLTRWFDLRRGRNSRRIFVSSTTKDLEAYRGALCQAGWWGQGKVPEFWSMDSPKAVGMTPLAWSIQQGLEADIVVALVGDRHGGLAEIRDDQIAVDWEQMRSLGESIPGWDTVLHPSKFSYTQWEILAALAGKAELLLFCPDDKVRHQFADQPGLAEVDWKRERQRLFADWARSRVTFDEFSGELDLAIKVREAIIRALKREGRGQNGLRAAVALLAASLALVGFGQWRSLREAREAKGMVLLGTSLAMVGQSDDDVFLPVMDRAFQRIDLPLATEQGFREDFISLNRQIRQAPFQASDYQVTQLRKLRTQVSLHRESDIGEAVALGYHLAVCRFAIDHQPGSVLAAHWAVARDLSQKAVVPADLRAAIAGIDASQTGRPADPEALKLGLARIFSLLAAEDSG